MQQVFIERFLEESTADDMLMSVLEKLPDEAFEPLMEIKVDIEENGMTWATRQMQLLCKKYLSDDKELMQFIDEDECYCDEINNKE